MKRGYKYLIITLLNIFFWNINAQSLPKVQVQTDTTQIRIGEQIRLRLQAETDTLSFVDFPELSELGDFEVVKTDNVDTLQSKPTRRLSKDYYITQWDSGQYVIPQIDLQINDSILRTDSIPNIKVLGVKVDTIKQPAYGFKNIINANGQDASKQKSSSFNYWWLLSLLLLIPLIYFIIKKRKEYIEKRKPLTPIEKAEKALNKLKKDKLWLQDKIDIHYLHLTDLIKEYLENELGLSAKEKISSEILQDLKKYKFDDGSYLSDDLLQKLQAMLQRADLAKYAKVKPAEPDIDLDLQLTNDLLDTSHEIISRIESEKQEKLAEIEARKKRRKRFWLIFAGSIVALLLLIGGTTYYFLKKYGVLEQVKENISAPEWVYSEYGANPAVGITTPHILKPIDFVDKLPEIQQKEIKTAFDEISVYGYKNLIKGYQIGILNFDLRQLASRPKQDIKFDSKDLNPFIINGMLQNIKAQNVEMKKDETDDGERYYGKFDMIIPKINVTKTFNFDIHIYNGDKYIRAVTTIYKKGSQENKELIDRVLNSVELIKD